MKIEPQTSATPTSLPIFTVEPRFSVVVTRAQNTCFPFFMELCSTCIINMLTELTCPVCSAVPCIWHLLLPILLCCPSMNSLVYIFATFPYTCSSLVLFLKLFQNMNYLTTLSVVGHTILQKDFKCFMPEAVLITYKIFADMIEM